MALGQHGDGNDYARLSQYDEIKFVIEGTNPDPEGHNFVFVVLIVLMAGPAGLQVLMSVYGVVTNGNGYV